MGVNLYIHHYISYKIEPKGFYHFIDRRPYITLLPGTLYTNRWNLFPEVLVMNGAQNGLEGEWDNFWSKTERTPILYTGEWVREIDRQTGFPIGGLTIPYFVFLSETRKILLPRTDLWKLKILRKSHQHRRI